jgi:hypothetical protein
VSRARDLLAALSGSQPDGLDGESPLGIPGISGIPRGRTWDALVSAHAPALTGETVTFVALDDGTLVIDDDVPDESLGPLADAIEEMLKPPYRAAAMRSDADAWTAVAEAVVIAELPGLEGDVVDLTVVGGIRELTVDDETTIRPLPGLDSLTEERGDVALHAERVDDDLFAVDVFPL